MTDPNGAAIYMVCHGSHQYTPNVSRYTFGPYGQGGKNGWEWNFR